MCCPSNKSITFILCMMGLLLSLYALYVETQASLDPEYVALCVSGHGGEGSPTKPGWVLP